MIESANSNTAFFSIYLIYWSEVAFPIIPFILDLVAEVIYLPEFKVRKPEIISYIKGEVQNVLKFIAKA